MLDFLFSVNLARRTPLGGHVKVCGLSDAPLGMLWPVYYGSTL